jgi:pimeloyl-ACP methyl ester carboxylesterase
MGPKPVLIFHGELDIIAYPSEARRNIEALQGPTTVVWQPRTGHAEGRWERAEEYHAALMKFVDEIAPPKLL